ncbi:MAG: GDSL-type esterase/lipase family protein [Planctomycetota bacterium]
MKHILLLGDSIRMGYEPHVRERLADIAAVRSPQKNGGNTRFCLEHLDAWLAGPAPDVIHVNVGLHDLGRDRGNPANRVPSDEYARNLREIFARLVRVGGAAVIWAAITPVNEKRHNTTKEFDRFEADVDRYNRVAREAVAEFRFPVNDLFARVMTAGRDDLLLPDGVHFTDAGYALLGGTVANIIRDHLKPGKDS